MWKGGIRQKLEGWQFQPKHQNCFNETYNTDNNSKNNPKNIAKNKGTLTYYESLCCHYTQKRACPDAVEMLADWLDNNQDSLCAKLGKEAAILNAVRVIIWDTERRLCMYFEEILKSRIKSNSSHFYVQDGMLQTIWTNSGINLMEDDKDIFVEIPEDTNEKVVQTLRMALAKWIKKQSVKEFVAIQAAFEPTSLTIKEVLQNLGVLLDIDIMSSKLNCLDIKTENVEVRSNTQSVRQQNQSQRRASSASAGLVLSPSLPDSGNLSPIPEISMRIKTTIIVGNIERLILASGAVGNSVGNPLKSKKTALKRPVTAIGIQFQNYPICVAIRLSLPLFWHQEWDVGTRKSIGSRQIKGSDELSAHIHAPFPAQASVIHLHSQKINVKAAWPPATLMMRIVPLAKPSTKAYKRREFARTLLTNPEEVSCANN
ncbi:hypothetical protein BC830DRAFT_1221472 [Chytriomyces sp. MP71]|nr:hypothetical protein BC830DRAFT_1221472 [Chytriomyces sp. MP71]